MSKRLLLAFLLSYSPILLFSQVFTTLDWQELRIDSVVPVYSEVVPLETDYRTHSYRLAISFPEWEETTEEENKALGEAERRARLAALVEGRALGEAELADDWSIISDTLRPELSISVSRGQGFADISFVPIVRRGKGYAKLVSAKIEIISEENRKIGEWENRAGASTRSASDEAAPYALNSVLSSGKWIKLSVTDDGVYRLPKSTIANLGLDAATVQLWGYGGHRLSEVSDPENEIDDLTQVRLYERTDDYVFWGNGVLYWDGDDRVFNPYSTAGYYFVTSGDGALRYDETLTSDGVASRTVTCVADHVLYEKDEYAWYAGGRNLYESTNYANTTSHTYKLSTKSSAGGERLRVVFTAAADAKTYVTPTVNSTAQTAMSISALGDYTYGVSVDKTYDVSELSTGDAWTVRLSVSPANDARLDYLALHYDRTLSTADDGFIAFGGEEAEELTSYKIEGTNIVVLDLTDGVVVPFTNGLTAAVDPRHSFVAFDASRSFGVPTTVGAIDNQNLHGSEQADMVIIIPASGKLLSQAQRLAEAHAVYDGLTTLIVRADQVYNEFSSGTPDATAYRRLMKMLYDRAESEAEMPRYLLLMGDCAWDNRMISTSWASASPDDYLLCFESENSLSDVYCYVMEDYFGLLDDGEGASLTSDKVDIGVGRFPVVSEAEAKVMVDKSIAHMANSYAGNWKNVVCFIGDDGDSNLHMRYADDVAERVGAQNPEMEVRKVMFDQYTRQTTITHNTYPEVTALLKEQMEEGALVMNYTGHAAAYCLSHELVLETADFEEFQGTKLPLWFTAACDVMPFDGKTKNIGETAVLNDGGAAVAFYGTTRTAYSSNNLQMNRWFMKYLFDTDDAGKRYRIGDAIRLAKNYMISNSLEITNKQNKLHYALLGDPALVFGAPTNRVVLDSINGKPVGAETQLSAGQAVRMSGHVEDTYGDVIGDFCGTLSARLYDSAETVTCKNNAGASSTFTFTSRDKVLFNGQDSVSNGRWEIAFVVPSDINFSDEAGRVVFYAVSTDLGTEANGYSESFTVGGVSDNDDNEGPEIVAYLGADSFTDGDRVSPTPLFVAELWDESGINYSGNGVGHDLLLTIDNDVSTTYTLNDYYQGVFGDYTRGTVAYSIPELEDGQHTLTFRAWDVLNNTSTATLSFVVDSSLEPQLLSVLATPSPATEQTTFVISHDRAGAETDITVEVYDFAGRLMWRHEETSTSTTGISYVTWDLTTGAGGRLGQGVYVYKVTLRQGDSKRAVKGQKLVVGR